MVLIKTSNNYFFIQIGNRHFWCKIKVSKVDNLGWIQNYNDAEWQFPSPHSNNYIYAHSRHKK